MALKLEIFLNAMTETPEQQETITKIIEDILSFAVAEPRKNIQADSNSISIHANVEIEAQENIIEIIEDKANQIIDTASSPTGFIRVAKYLWKPPQIKKETTESPTEKPMSFALDSPQRPLEEALMSTLCALDSPDIQLETALMSTRHKQRQTKTQQPISAPVSQTKTVNQVWAEITLADKQPSRPQPPLHLRYNARFTTPTRDYRAIVDIPTEFFAEVKSRDRKDFNELIKISQSDIIPLSTAFKQLQKLENYSNERLANVILNFAQSIPYIKDKISAGMEDYHAYAIETLANGLGDCEDKAILGAAIYKNLGYDVILINPPAHLTIGIAGNYKGYGIDYEGEHYYYAEVTTPGWQIGELRADLTNTEMNVIAI